MAEAWRNLTAVGARPLAITDNLNFGNPEKPEIMGQFAAAIGGMAEACGALDFPVVSGNVSLYNETEGRAILPTPAIGGLGVLDDAAQAVGLALPPWLDLVLIGATAGWLGQSLWLREIAGREDGAAAAGRSRGRARATAISCARRSWRARCAACHDVSDGGLLVAVAEMAMAGGTGVPAGRAAASMPAHAFWFGEDQARYVLAVPDGARAGPRRRQAGSAARALRIGTSRRAGFDSARAAEPYRLRRCAAAHERFFPAGWMGR